MNRKDDGNRMISVHPIKYAVLLCFVLLGLYHSCWQIHMHYLPISFKVTLLPLGQSYGAIIGLPQWQWSNLEGYGKNLPVWKLDKRQIMHIILGMYCATCYDQFIISSFTHWGRDNMAAISQTTFSWMKMYKFQLRFHWSLFSCVQLTIFQRSFR